MGEWLNEWLPYGWLFLSTTGLLMLLFFWRRRGSRAEERLSYPDPDDDGELPRPILGPFLPALAGLMRVREAQLPELENDLRLAGYYRPSALAEYLALRALGVLAPLFIAAVFALLVPEENMDGVLVTGLVACGLGFSLPRLHLVIRGRTRARQMERGLPIAIDLLTLCLTAGQNLLSALRQVSLEMRYSHPVLAQELAIASRQAELHSLQQAMKQWSERVNVPDVTNVALLMIQSERLGTDAAATLGELATNFRTNLRQRAEAQANRTSFWMLFPSVFCFWLASAIVLVGPPYAEFLQHRRESTNAFDKSRENILRANQRLRLGTARDMDPTAQ
jgi:tight adherence protein C